MTAAASTDAGRGTNARAWTFVESVQLEARALAWMLGVTLPALVAVATVVGALVGPSSARWSTASQAVPWAVLVTGIAVLPTVAASIVVLPVTHLVGLALRRVRSDGAHVAWTGVTAGVLALLSVVVLCLLLSQGAAGEPDGQPILVGAALYAAGSAGSAGALARRGQIRRARKVPTV